jgi:hypothetical protein
VSDESDKSNKRGLKNNLMRDVNLKNEGDSCYGLK